MCGFRSIEYRCSKCDLVLQEGTRKKKVVCDRCGSSKHVLFILSLKKPPFLPPEILPVHGREAAELMFASFSKELRALQKRRPKVERECALKVKALRERLQTFIVLALAVPVLFGLQIGNQSQNGRFLAPLVISGLTCSICAFFAVQVYLRPPNRAQINVTEQATQKQLLAIDSRINEINSAVEMLKKTV